MRDFTIPLVCSLVVGAGCGASDDEAPAADARPSTPTVDASVAADASTECVQAPRTACGPTEGITITRYTDRAAFEAALPNLCLQVVDFDDVDTSGAEPVAIDAERYKASHSVVITGTGGQFVDETFEIGEDFVPTSAPNQYAPGPEDVPGGDPGGHDTDVTFRIGGDISCVAGFGAVFIDADFPGIAASSLAVFSYGDVQLDLDETITGDDASQIFRGMIATDASGNPVPVIARAHLVNGNEWPARDVDEGVTLDDFIFDTPDIED